MSSRGGSAGAASRTIGPMDYLRFDNIRDSDDADDSIICRTSLLPLESPGK